MLTAPLEAPVAVPASAQRPMPAGEAFELTVNEVRHDWPVVRAAGDGEQQDLLEQLRLEQGWDVSVAPYYVDGLRRRNGT